MTPIRSDGSTAPIIWDCLICHLQSRPEWSVLPPALLNVRPFIFDRPYDQLPSSSCGRIRRQKAFQLRPDTACLFPILVDDGLDENLASQLSTSLSTIVFIVSTAAAIALPLVGHITVRPLEYSSSRYGTVFCSVHCCLVLPVKHRLILPSWSTFATRRKAIGDGRLRCHRDRRRPGRSSSLE